MVQIRQLSSLKSIHLVASFVIGFSISYHKKSVIFCSKCVYWWTECVSLSMRCQVPCVSTVSNQEPRYVIEWVGNFYSLNAMISDILLNIVFFAEFSLNANFLRVGVIEVIFFTGNFNQKFSSTCCAFRMKRGTLGGTQYRNTVRKNGKYRNTASKIV